MHPLACLPSWKIVFYWTSTFDFIVTEWNGVKSIMDITRRAAFAKERMFSFSLSLVFPTKQRWLFAVGGI